MDEPIDLDATSLAGLTGMAHVKLPNLGDIFHHRRHRKGTIEMEKTKAITDLIQVDPNSMIWSVEGSDGGLYSITYNSDERRWEEVP